MPNGLLDFSVIVAAFQDQNKFSSGSRSDRSGEAVPSPSPEFLQEKQSQLDLTDSGGEEQTVTKPFDPAHCLSCNQRSANLTENMRHIQKRHALFVTSPDNLIVDLETLMGYFHLVIFEYAECLLCGSVRNSPQAAQQHMAGKGHCRIDIAREGSEFRDFYDFDAGSGTGSEEDASEGKSTKGDTFVELAEQTRRLASGKILSHRSIENPQAHRYIPAAAHNRGDALLEDEKPPTSEQSTALMSGVNGRGELTAAEKREALFDKQLAALRPGDRQALMHLPLPQQRALVAKAKKQQERWNREQMAQKIKRQLKANP
ncbi:TRI15 [Colletotrichum tabaci]|uniref:TRI15 n=1 Tax=Colletotrichum tabaci TaxID=1209068 RepID=A0AAV9TBF8_9PEZI